MKLYGYNSLEKKKFEVSVEDICDAINSVGIFSDNYYVFVNKSDRDSHAEREEV